MMERKRKLSLRTKLSFSSGSLEEAMLGAAGVATMIYYNQVLDVSAALCGTVFLIASMIDAVSDPLVGALSDSVNTRWGRRHPFMFVSAFPLGLFFYFLYQPPSGLSEFQLFIWFTIMLVGLRLAKTFYAVPHSALGAELTDDYDERTSVFGWNFVVGSIGGAILGVFVLYVIFPSVEGVENGLLREDRYPILAVVGGVFVTAMVLFCTFMTADQIPYLHDSKTVGERTKQYFRSFLKDTLGNLWVLAHNPSYISVCACWLILAISGGVLAVVSTYTFVYAFEFSTEEIAIRGLIALPGAFLGIVFSRWLVSRLDKKYTVIFTILVTAFLIGLPFCLRLLGWFPENGTVWTLVAFFAIWTPALIFLPVVPIVIDSQLVDITDEHELQTGNRSEGVIFSIRTFAIKMTSGLGGLMGGFGLELINFPKDASIETLDPAVIDGLLWMMGPLYILIVYTGLGFAFLYRIDRRRHQEIIEALESRRLQA
jgi:glycoside/pentoside/hexuronide:cation symporter, GPH family